MKTLSRGDPLVVVDKRGRIMYRCLYWGVDKDDPQRWVFVLFPKTRHLARMNPRWLKRVYK
jgi:hypothetical protein